MYSRTLREAELTAGKPLGLTTEIVDQKIQGIGDITQIIPLLISQFDKSLTYVTIAAALLFDILLITFFTRYLHGQVVHPNSRSIGSPRGAFGVSASKSTNLIEKTEGSSRGASS